MTFSVTEVSEADLVIEVDPDDWPVDVAPRWNTWVILQSVQFEGEERPTPRGVRLCCASARVGDAVRIMDGVTETTGLITAVRHSTLHVARRRP